MFSWCRLLPTVRFHYIIIIAIKDIIIVAIIKRLQFDSLWNEVHDRSCVPPLLEDTILQEVSMSWVYSPEATLARFVFLPWNLLEALVQ